MEAFASSAGRVSHSQTQVQASPAPPPLTLECASGGDAQAVIVPCKTNPPVRYAHNRLIIHIFMMQTMPPVQGYPEQHAGAHILGGVVVDPPPPQRIPDTKVS
mmetsp:Transcript_23071/g.50625  ORF Transcript_23071/g.50625 Transcript_23071/m.50625 type:complete len:103 (+) Transcript_23071:394-702(+)